MCTAVHAAWCCIAHFEAVTFSFLACHVPKLTFFCLNTCVYYIQNTCWWTFVNNNYWNFPPKIQQRRRAVRNFNNVGALSGNWAEVSMRLSSRQCAPAACYSEFRKQVLRGHDVFRFHGGASSKNLFCVAPPTVQTRKVFEKSAELVLILSYYYYLFRIRIAILHM